MLTFAARVLREPVFRATALAIGCLTAAALILSSPVRAQGPESPPGNNGTVKIHEGGDEPTPIRRNHPHVCTFHLHFFGGDADQDGQWWVESWPPGGDRSVVLSGDYTADANGEARDPETGAHSLDPGHYKLFWQGAENPGDQTNAKHKVFWVDCADESGAAASRGGSQGGEVLSGSGGALAGSGAGGAGAESRQGTLAGAGGPGAGTLPDTQLPKPNDAAPTTIIVGLIGAAVLISARRRAALVRG